MKSLILYMYNTCPYCQKVIRYIDESGRKDIEYRNIHESPEAADELVKVGGKRQVPCLFINGNPLYESDDIISWLAEHPET